MRIKLLQLCPTLCDAMDYNLPGSSVYGIFQARLLEWIAISGEFSRLKDWTHISWGSCIGSRFFIISATWEDCTQS